jgi:hypothetical protein
MRLRSTGVAIGIAVLLGSVLANPVQAAVSAAPNPAASAGTASAASNPYSPAYHHPYREGAVPTLAAKTQMDDYAAAHPAAKAPAPSTVSNQVSYRGGFAGTGAFTGSVKVYLIFWGSQWGTAGTNGSGYTTLSGDPSGAAPYVQGLLAGLGTDGETWSGVATQYCAGLPNGMQSCPSNFPHVVYPTGGALGGVWVDESAAAPSNATVSQLAAEAEAGASHFGNTTVAANTNAQYVVLSPAGTHPDGFNTPTGSFCAWHNDVSTSYGDVAYQNMPYVTDMGTSCGENYVNPGAAGTLDGVAMVEGHEYAETLTDRSIDGWGDAYGNEIADKCVWNGTGAGGAADLSLATGSFAMQSLWANDANSGAGGCEFTHPIVTSNSNLALNQPVTASSSSSGYPASNATDGNTASYWESQDGSGFPQTLTVDLGAATEVGQVVLALPSSWGSRTQTLSVSTSPDGTNYYTSVASASYTFNPTGNNTVTIPVPDSWARYVRLTVTANTGWPAAQLSGFQVYPPTPLATGSAAVLQLSSSNNQTIVGVVGTTSAGPTFTLHNPGTAAVALASITSSTTDFGQASTCGNSLGAGDSCTISTTFTPSMTGIDYNGMDITANGGPYLASMTGIGTTNVALNKAATVSSTNSTYVAGNMVDGNTSTYWESTNAWPQSASADLGTSPDYGGTYTIASLVLTLPPSWASRTETLSIDVSGDNVNFTQAVASATYTFNPATGNTVTIPLSADDVRAVRLDFTANSGWPAAQLSEFEIYGY